MALGGDLVGRAYVRLDADTSSFDRRWANADREFDRRSKRMGTAARVGIAAGVAVAATALYGLARGARAAWDEMLEGQRVGAQTAAVIKSTGGAANVSAKDVDRLSIALMRKSGVDDETIKSGANMLLTFKRIRNETGAGKDIFDQATTSVLNLSVGMGKDMRSSAIMVGKALNDPIRGLTSLGRAGVQFSDSQKATITRMTEAGNVMGAQKIILKELESQFGGSAEAAGKTFGGQLSLVREEALNAGAALLEWMAPALVTVFGAVANLIPKIEILVGWLGDKLAPVGKIIGDVFTGLRMAFVGGSGTFGHIGNEAFKAGELIKRVWNGVSDALGRIVAFIRERFGPIWESVMGIIRESVARIAIVFEEHRPELERIWTRLSTILERTGRIIEAVLKHVVVPILRVVFVEVLPRVIGGAIEILDKLIGWWETLQRVILRVVSFVLTALDKFLGGLSSLARAASHLPLVGDKFKGVADAIDGSREHLRDLRDELDRLTRRPHNVKVDAKIAFKYGMGVAKAEGAGDGIGMLHAGLEQGVGAGVRAGLALPRGSRPDVSAHLWDELGMARVLGLGVSSTHRPGATTRSGNRSFHSYYPSQAVDLTDGTRRGFGSPAMRTMFQFAAGRAGLDEVILSPYLWTSGGGTRNIAGTQLARDHEDHVHLGGMGDGLGVPFQGDSAYPGGSAWDTVSPFAKPFGKRPKETTAAYRRRLHQWPATEMPAGIALALANAAATSDWQDDLREREAWHKRLHRIRKAEWLSAQQKADVQNELNRLHEELRGIWDEAHPPPEEVPAGEEPGAPTMTQAEFEAQAAAFLETRRGFFGSFAPNIFHRGPGGLEPGSVGHGGGGTVVVHNHFNQPPADPYPLMQATAFAAEWAMG